MSNFKRIVIFAHFDKHNIIDPYVIECLEELKNYSEIIFVSDGNLATSETAKIKDLCFDFISEKHGEYDFGSYKRGFQLIQLKYPQKLQEIDELLFVNDSCYLIGDLKKIFIDMAKKQDCDFWGLTDDYDHFQQNNIYYIGSFFLSFRKSVFLEKFFTNFLLSVEKLPNHNAIVYQYEIGMSKMLQKNNKKSFCYFSRERIALDIVKKMLSYSQNITSFIQKNKKQIININDLNNLFNIYTLNYLHSNKIFFLLKMGFPLIKRQILRNNILLQEKILFLWRELLQELNKKSIIKIENHCKRIGTKLKQSYIIKNQYLYKLYLVTAIKPFYIKKYIKNDQNITTIKLLFFKIKTSDFTRIKLSNTRM
jgi:hypothetical protein